MTSGIAEVKKTLFLKHGRQKQAETEELWKTSVSDDQLQT